MIVDPGAEPLRLAVFPAEPVEDPLLTELNDEALSTGAAPPEASRGTRPLDDLRGPARDPPFDVEVVRPRAIDLRRLYALAGKSVPDDLRASLGPKRPLLVCHGLTPFHRPGARVSSIWGLGYEAQLCSPDGATVALFPESQTVRVGSLEQCVQVGIGAGGALDVPKDALELAKAVPGIKITGAELSATTSSHLGLALSLTLTLRAVEAGPVGAGGVRWNIYHHKERLDCYQALFQTLLVRDSEQQLGFRIRTWIRSHGLFGLGAKQWISEWQDVQVPLV
ncbi:MAG: hypothetical protein JW940_16590 [Polyangiaceae bacterium]|nr:hypothetical protein [Polyangiaceae bacterium]